MADSKGPKQYYVAVGTPDTKLATLVELLHALQQDSRLALALCCSSRDSLDCVVGTLMACSGFSLAVLHADMSEHEMELQLLELKQLLQQADPAAGPSPSTAGTDQAQPSSSPANAAAHAAAPSGGAQQGEGAAASQWGQQRAQGPGGGAGRGDDDEGAPPTALVLVTTDACLKAVSKDVLPVGLPLLVQYNIPATKDIYLRRLGAVFGASRERKRGPRPVIIDFVVAGEMERFRARERFSSAGIRALPVHVPDIFVT